jgi:hypothetical protein
MTKKRIHKSIF